MAGPSPTSRKCLGGQRVTWCRYFWIRGVYVSRRFWKMGVKCLGRSHCLLFVFQARITRCITGFWTKLVSCQTANVQKNFTNKPELTQIVTFAILNREGSTQWFCGVLVPCRFGLNLQNFTRKDLAIILRIKSTAQLFVVISRANSTVWLFRVLLYCNFGLNFDVCV